MIICIFGDSITWGASDFEKGGWANRLRNYLEHKDKGDKIYNLGIGGDTTYINSPDNTTTGIKTFRKNLRLLTEETKLFTDKIIFIGLTTVDETKTKPTSWNKFLFYDNENITIYNDAIKNFCLNKNIPFIKISALNNKDFEEDGLHPNSQGHEKIFNTVKDFLIKNKWID